MKMRSLCTENPIKPVIKCMPRKIGAGKINLGHYLMQNLPIVTEKIHSWHRDLLFQSEMVGTEIICPAQCEQ